jgi:DNA-binding NarL/FixJ family response regulator
VSRVNEEIRVVLADDHHFFREGLRGTLEAEGIVVVGEAGDGLEAVALATDLQPDVIVMDLNMPNCSGIEATRRILAIHDDIQIVVLTVSADDADVVTALLAGASSYMLKDAKLDDLTRGIRQVAAGDAVLSGEVAGTLLARVRASARASGAEQTRANTSEPPADRCLTARESEVLRLIVTGADNAAIGNELSISPHTVKQYVANIFEKLGVHSRVQAAVHAIRAGLA